MFERRGRDSAGSTSTQAQTQTSPGKATLTEQLVQRRGASDRPSDEATHAIAAEGVRGGGGALPHRDAIAASFGKYAPMVDGISAHVGGDAARASGAIGAEAYATGSSIAFAKQPDLALAAHEAAHVVQQAGGVQLKGGVGEAGDAYEHHADAVAAKVVAGESAESLLDTMAGGGTAAATGATQRSVQRRDVPTHYGTFKSPKFQKVGTTGVEAIIEFHPDENQIDARKIGLSQSVAVTNTDSSHTANDPTTEGRRVRSGAGQDYNIDRISERNNPIYGAQSVGANQGIDQTAQDNNTSGDPTKVDSRADGGNATYQLGHAYREAGALHKKEASLWDRPNAGSKHFETTALGLEGRDKDKYFGSVRWGYTRAGGDVTIEDIELASMGVPTQNFLAPAAQWNSTTARGTLEVSANPAHGWTSPGTAAVDIPRGTQVTQLGVYIIHNVPTIEAQALTGGTRWFIKVTDVRDLGDGGATADVPTADVFVNPAATGLFSDMRMTAKVKDLPANTRMVNRFCSIHGSWQMDIVDGPDTGQSGYVDLTKVRRER